MHHSFRQAIIPLLLLLFGTSPALADVLSNNRNIYINVSNDAGALYGTGATDSYYINAPGGGLNQLHITTDPSSSGVNGQVTTVTTDSSTASGTFWVSTTGGRGYNDDIILLFSLTGPISDDFSLSILSSGYMWTATTSAPVNPTYTSGALDETFTKDDFLYGPQTAKPGPGTLGVWSLPLYSGQDITDASTAQYLMFIDLNAGNISSKTLTDSGSVKVEFTITGLYDSIAAFNAYAWTNSADVANASINWTNRLSTSLTEAGQSGYSIVSTAVPTPEPSGMLLCAAGLPALSFLRRHFCIRSGRA